MGRLGIFIALRKKMIDKNFEIDTEGGGLKFETFSEGWSNADEINGWHDPEFDRKYLKYLKEVADAMGE